MSARRGRPRGQVPGAGTGVGVGVGAGAAAETAAKLATQVVEAEIAAGQLELGVAVQGAIEAQLGRSAGPKNIGRPRKANSPLKEP